MNKHPFTFNEHRLISQHTPAGPEERPAGELETRDKKVDTAKGKSPEAKEVEGRIEALENKKETFQPEEAENEAKKAEELADKVSRNSAKALQTAESDARETAKGTIDDAELAKQIEEQLQVRGEQDEAPAQANEMEVDSSVKVATGGEGGDDAPLVGGDGLFNVGPEKVKMGRGRTPGGPGEGKERRPTTLRRPPGVRGNIPADVLAQMAPAGDGGEGAPPEEGDDAPPEGEGDAPPEEAAEAPPADSVLADARRKIQALGPQIMKLRQQAARSPEKAEEVKQQIAGLLAQLNGAKERMRAAKEELRDRPMTKGEKSKMDIKDAQDVLNDPTASGLDKLGAVIELFMGYYELWTMGDKRNEMYKPPEGEGSGRGGETPPPSPEQQMEIAQDKELREEIKREELGPLKTRVANERRTLEEKLNGHFPPGLIDQRTALEQAAAPLKAAVETKKAEIAEATDANRPRLQGELATMETNLRKNQIDLESIQKQITDAKDQDAKLKAKLERIDKIEKSSNETKETMENGKRVAVEALRIFEGDGIPQAKEFADLLDPVTVNLDPQTLELSLDGGAGLSQRLKEISRDLLGKVPGNEELGIDLAGKVQNPDALMGFMEKLTQKFETNARQEVEKRERIRQSGNEILHGKGLQMRGADTFKLVVNGMTTIYKFENGKWQWSMAENGAFDDVPQNMWPGGGENATKANAIARELSKLGGGNLG